MSRTLITVPMKDPSASKTRLAGTLAPGTRARLVCLLYRRTLEVLVGVAEITGAELVVVTSSDTAAQIAGEFGVEVLWEPDHVGLTQAVTLAADHAIARGFDRYCVIPADLAAPMVRDLVRFLDSSAGVTLCPSTDQGTNALLVSPPDAIGFHYGPHSAIRHLREAQSKGLSTCLMPLDSLSFDIDTSDCLNRAMRSQPEIARICA